MKFYKGQQVAFIDENLQGIIIAVQNDRIIVETDEGFEMEATPGELVLLSGLDDLDFQEERIAQALAEKQSSQKKHVPAASFKANQTPMEVDLHAHQLTAHEKRMSNFEILNLQLDTARSRLEFAIEKRIQKIIFIHGVGEGVLRMELETLFSRYDTIDYYDADYRKYGLGATEVYIYQNKN